MDSTNVVDNAAQLATDAANLAAKAKALAAQATQLAPGAAAHGPDALTLGLTVFVLAVFVGYYVVWRVTPALELSIAGRNLAHARHAEQTQPPILEIPRSWFAGVRYSF